MSSQKAETPYPFFTTEYVTVGEICPVRVDETDQVKEYGLVLQVDEDSEDKIACIVLASRGLVRYTYADVHIPGESINRDEGFTVHADIWTSVFYDQIGDPVATISQEQLDKVAQLADRESAEEDTTNFEEILPEKIEYLVRRSQHLASRVLGYLLDDE